MSSCICLWGFINAKVVYGGLGFGGDGICSQSWVASPYTTIDMVSVLLYLPLPLPFSIVKALGTVLGSLKKVLESVYGSWGTCMPLEVVGWSGSA